jgi:hypothetical protein
MGLHIANNETYIAHGFAHCKNNTEQQTHIFIQYLFCIIRYLFFMYSVFIRYVFCIAYLLGIQSVFNPLAFVLHLFVHVANTFSRYVFCIAFCQPSLYVFSVLYSWF